MATGAPNPTLLEKGTADDESLQRYLEGHPGVVSFEPDTGPIVDESNTLFIGKEFTPERFAAWYPVQGLGTLPFNAVGIHHTWRPTASDWQGKATLNGVFNYYASDPPPGDPNIAGRPWPRGVGPHLYLYDGTGSYMHGQPLVYVATHPAEDGIGIIGHNHRWLHIEAIGDFQAGRMPPQMEDLYRFVLHVVCGDRIPLRDTKGNQPNGPTTPLGLLFHRDASGNSTSCPGDFTKAEWFYPSMLKAVTGFGQGQAQGVYSSASALRGTSAATPAHAFGYLLGRGVARETAATIVRTYASACGDAGLDFVLALAQTILETTNTTTRIPFTSWWSSAPRFNMAGIGVTGSTRPHANDGAPNWQPQDNGTDMEGYSFGNLEAGIMAHVVHLAAYVYAAGAEPAAFRSKVVREIDPRLPAMTSAGKRGSARAIGDLAGSWAADPNYAGPIVRLANAIATATPEPFPGLPDTEQAQGRQQGQGGQAPWHADTGHDVSGPFLAFWRARADALQLFGFPVSDEYLDQATGLRYQWFERARFERRPDSTAVSLGRVGAELAQRLAVPGATP